MTGWPGLLPLLVGLGLIAAPWWSSALPAADYPMAIVLGTLFVGLGAAVCVPESWPRVRSLAFIVFFGAFGTICGAIALSPRTPAPDGTISIGGIAGFSVSQAVPWWARTITGLFAVLFVVAAVLGAWGLLRSIVRRDASP
ncbi:MAG TPA: hypothetical protein VFC24_03060 [Casimicrobiaceae bacterium]|nr:hypothetical protein [Casimicrobiaceae bacterium]